MIISTTTTKSASFIMNSTPRRLNLRVVSEDGVFSTNIHCGLDVAKFSGYHGSMHIKKFIKLLDKNGFCTNNYAPSTLQEILDAYNEVLADFY